MICPRCSVAEISPLTDACELCGFAPDAAVAVAAQLPGAVDELAQRELASQLRIDFPIGQGPGSALYLAREKDSDRLVILKALLRKPEHGPDADHRFRAAVAVVQSLDHPHLVPILRFGTTDSLFWYTMEPVRGRPLREILRARGPMDLKSCLRMITQVASALDYAHRRAIVHGNLKPENVLIDHDGWARLCDAMIPRELERRATRASGSQAGARPSGAAPQPPQAGARPSGAVPRAGQSPALPAPAAGAPRSTGPLRPPSQRAPAGAPPTPPAADKAPAPRATSESPVLAPRPAYVSPEDHEGGLRGAPSDQFALAVLLYECLTGYPPGAGQPAGALPTPLAALRPDLPPSVPFAVERAMSARPTDRFATVLDFVTTLESGVLSTTGASPTGRATPVVLMDDDWEPPAVEPRPLHLRVLTVVGAVAIVLALGWGTSLLLSWQRAAQQRAAAVAAAPPPVVTAPAPVADSAIAVDSAAPPPAATAPATRRSNRGDLLRARATAPRSSSRSSRPSRSQARPPDAPTSPAAAAATGNGRLFVNATPWGQVFVDGLLIGNTPRANIELAAGTHRLRVVRDGFEPYERAVSVAPGETVRLTDIVLVVRRP